MNNNKALRVALESDEITFQQFMDAQHIRFEINDEDVPLFIQSLENLFSDPLSAHNECEDLLRNISCVEYVSEHDPIPDEYSGAYAVMFKDAAYPVLYGWKDSDSLAMLYPVELS